MRRYIGALFILFVVLTISSGRADASRPVAMQAASAPASLEFEQIASGLSSPVDIEHAGDGSNRLFIVLRGGQIVIYEGGQILSTPFLNISSLVTTAGGEQGLLGIAFHPNYKSNGYFYVDYTRKSDGATVITRYHVSANPNIADGGSAFPLLTISQPYSNHNGGQLKFGPDGYLYIGMGDGGSGGDPENRAQNPASLLGKILRIDVNSGSPYGIPANNPFVSDPNVDDRIWALGVRNPWRFSFDRLTGDLFIADVGQDAWEEVDYQPASSSGGANYGWSCYEGLHDYRSDRDCTLYGTLTSPILEYPHGTNDSNGCSISGGYIYRGDRYPALKGVYLYGDFCTGKIWAAVKSGSAWTSNLVADTNFLITTFGEDESGELYVASYGNGVIYHIAASSFADVPTSYWSWDYIERLYSSGITSGCVASPLQYCPEETVTRAQMAVLLLKGIHGPSYNPPPVGLTTGFNDVPTNYWAAAWIKQLALEGITSGCGDGNYCPEDPVTRAQMAVFLLKAKYGPSYGLPPVGTSTGFTDVPATYWAAAWIKQLAAESITGGCGGGNYCPEDPVTRAQMAVFLVKTFNLP